MSFLVRLFAPKARPQELRGIPDEIRNINPDEVHYTYQRAVELSPFDRKVQAVATDVIFRAPVDDSNGLSEDQCQACKDLVAKLNAYHLKIIELNDKFGDASAEFAAAANALRAFRSAHPRISVEGYKGNHNLY